MTLPALLRAPWRASIAIAPASDQADAAAVPTCPGCGGAVPRRYCGDCGERAAPDDLSLGALAAGAVEQLTALDVKLLRTVRLLVTRPGALTVEYRRGMRARYTRPLQLFLLVNAAFFIAMSHLNFLAGNGGATLVERPQLAVYKPEIATMQRAAGETPAQFYARFDRHADDLKRGLVALFVPALAATLSLLYARRRRYLVEHTVFATHLFTFSLIMLAGWVALMQGTRELVKFVTHSEGRHLPKNGWEVNVLASTSICVLLAVGGWYLWQSLRRAYGTAGWSTTWRAFVLGTVLLVGAALFPVFLFRLTLATL